MDIWPGCSSRSTAVSASKLYVAQLLCSAIGTVLMQVRGLADFGQVRRGSRANNRLSMLDSSSATHTVQLAGGRIGQ